MRTFKFSFFNILKYTLLRQFFLFQFSQCLANSTVRLGPKMAITIFILPKSKTSIHFPSRVCEVSLCHELLWIKWFRLKATSSFPKNWCVYQNILGLWCLCLKLPKLSWETNYLPLLETGVKWLEDFSFALMILETVI